MHAGIWVVFLVLFLHNWWRSKSQFSIEHMVTHALVAGTKPIYTHEGIIGFSSLKNICIWEEKVRERRREGGREGDGRKEL